MYTRAAQYYDKVYASKDYQSEAEKLHRVITRNLRSESAELLDVACGTGRHIEYLKQWYTVQGMDITPALLEYARKRNPDVSFTVGDMTSFDLGRQFDVVTCLFSAIGYATTLESLKQACACMGNHVAPGGLLIIEPWFSPFLWKNGIPHALVIDEPGFKLARLNTSFKTGALSYFDFHYTVATSRGVEHFVERHELGLFTIDEMTDNIEHAGFDVEYDAEGITGRGLYIGLKR